jgi:hypothetical protein
VNGQGVTQVRHTGGGREWEYREREAVYRRERLEAVEVV